VAGREVTVAEPWPTPAGNVVDLMSALKASLERGSAASGQGRTRGHAAARRPPKRAPARPPGGAHPRAHRKAAHS